MSTERKIVSKKNEKNGIVGIRTAEHFEYGDPPALYSVQPCPDCKGHGVTFTYQEGSIFQKRELCPTCKGWRFVRVPFGELPVVRRIELPVAAAPAPEGSKS